MRPTKQLKAEHEGIKLMLKILGKICDAPEKLNQEHFAKILEFLKVFADKCHHGKEENLLLPALAQAGIPGEKDIIAFTLNDHKEGRGYIKSMSEAFERLEKGDKKSTAEIVENARKYINLLTKHIYKEDNTLFPLADKILSEAKQGELEEAFEKLEEEEIGIGKHDEFHGLLHELREIYLK